MSFSYRLLCLAAFAAFPGWLLAGDSEAPSAGYHLKNKSSFNLTDAARPPIWPIGYVHHTGPKADAPVEIQEPKLDPDQYAVTSILLGSPSLAVINGRTFAEGEYLRFGRSRPNAGAPAAPKIRVTKVTDGYIILATEHQQVQVPLRRQQFQMRRTDDDPLQNQ